MRTKIDDVNLVSATCKDCWFIIFDLSVVFPQVPCLLNNEIVTGKLAYKNFYAIWVPKWYRCPQTVTHGSRPKMFAFILKMKEINFYT